MPPASRYVKLNANPQNVTFADVPPQTDTSGQYGPRLNYVVNGKQILTASNYLSERIEAALAEIPQGEQRILTMRMYKNSEGKTRYDVTPVVHDDMSWEEAVAAPTRRAPPSTQQPSKLPVLYATRDFQSVVNDYATCLAHAKLLCDGALNGLDYTSEDIRSIGTTLFIEANRSNMTIPPLYDENSEVTDDDEEY